MHIQALGLDGAMECREECASHLMELDGMLYTGVFLCCFRHRWA